MGGSLRVSPSSASPGGAQGSHLESDRYRTTRKAVPSECALLPLFTLSFSKAARVTLVQALARPGETNEFTRSSLHPSVSGSAPLQPHQYRAPVLMQPSVCSGSPC